MDGAKKSSQGPIQSYGIKIRYSTGIKIVFPDFVLTFVEKRHKSHAVFKPGFDYYDFNVETEKQKQTISWCSGTGDIAPLYFVMDGVEYGLELKLSDKLGQLASDELVVWKQ